MPHRVTDTGISWDIDMHEAKLVFLLDYYLCRQRNGDQTIVLILRLCLEQLIDGIDAMLMMCLRSAEHTEQPSRMRWLGWLGHAVNALYMAVCLVILANLPLVLWTALNNTLLEFQP